MKILILKDAVKFLESLNSDDRSKFDRIRELFDKYGFQIGPKYIKKIRDELWELRAGKVRVLLFLKGNFAYGVNAIYKKSQKLPKHEIKLAVKRSQRI